MFDRYMDIKFYLEDNLGKKVDLISWQSLKPQQRESVEKEAVYCVLEHQNNDLSLAQSYPPVRKS